MSRNGHAVPRGSTLNKLHNSGGLQKANNSKHHHRADLFVGQVVITGLQSAKSLNGEVGEIVSPDEGCGRCGVILSDGRQKSVKRVNLLPF